MCQIRMHFVISFQHLDGRRWSCVNKITVIFSLTLRFSQFNWLFNNIGNIKMENLQLWHNFQNKLAISSKTPNPFEREQKMRTICMVCAAEKDNRRPMQKFLCLGWIWWKGQNSKNDLFGVFSLEMTSLGWIWLLKWF